MLKNNETKRFLLVIKSFYLSVAKKSYEISLWATNKDYFIKEAEYFINQAEIINQDLIKL